VLGQIDLASQSLFAGRYRIVRRIAAGGMGAVFEVVHVETQRRRALKVMLPELLANRQLRERFQMEARITANVETEYIVDVFDAGIDEATGMPFLVMELLNGEDLGKAQDRAGRFSAEQVVTYLRQVASALDKTHAAGIVHRDLKPENLFLTHREDGTPRVKILDFGISKVVTEAQTGANATRGLGTPLYMAPEQVLAQTVGPATDLYALGLIAYSLLVGVPYWQLEAETFDNPITFVVHTSKGATDSAVARAAGVGHTLPPAFDAWFRRATHLEPARRFRSASELVSELAQSLSVALPVAAGRVTLADSSGVHLPSAALAAAETMVARTAPGTEFDRQGTLSGTGRPKRSALWLALGIAALAAVVVLVLALRSSSSPGIAPSEVKSSAALPAADTAVVPTPPVDPIAVVPSARASAVAIAETSKPPPAASVSAKATGVKNSGTAHSVAAAKAATVSAHAAQAPKYTRD
jgi:serine/threonine protein kinase